MLTIHFFIIFCFFNFAKKKIYKKILKIKTTTKLDFRKNFLNSDLGCIKKLKIKKLKK